MTSTERVRCVLSGRPPDRVPVLLQNFQNTAYLAGMSLREFCRNGQYMAEAQLAAWERFGYDVLDLENGIASMAEALGCEVVYPESAPPQSVRPAPTSLDDVDRLRSVDPTRDGLLPELLKATRLVRAGLKGRACIVGEAGQGPFALCSSLMGMEPWLIAVAAEQPDKIFRLIEFAYEQVLRLCLAQAEAGADFVEIGDAVAGPDVCSPRIYRQFAFPFEKRLAAELATRGIPMVLHICGNATPIIADMAATGAAMLMIDYKVDAARCREATQQNAVLVGNIDPSGIMCLGTPAQVLEKSRQAIEQMGSRGRFILSPGCTLPATTPPENTMALVQAAREYGYTRDGILTKL